MSTKTEQPPTSNPNPPPSTDPNATPTQSPLQVDTKIPSTPRDADDALQPIKIT